MIPALIETERYCVVIIDLLEHIVSVNAHMITDTRTKKSRNSLGASLKKLL